MFWTIWIEHNGRVFNQEQCHKVNVKHIIWDNIIVHAKVAWARVVQDLLRLAHTKPKPFSKVSTRLNAIHMSFVVNWNENHLKL